MDPVEEVLGDLDADEVADDEGGEYGEEGCHATPAPERQSLTQRPGSLGNLSDPPEINILERITSTSQSARYRHFVRGCWSLAKEGTDLVCHEGRIREVCPVAVSLEHRDSGVGQCC